MSNETNKTNQSSGANQGTGNPNKPATDKPETTGSQTQRPGQESEEQKSVDQIREVQGSANQNKPEHKTTESTQNSDQNQKPQQSGSTGSTENKR